MTQPADKATTRLHDVQGFSDERGVALQKVGVKGVEMPIRLLQKDGGTQSVSARAAMGVYLSHELKGTHMSRFVIQLTEWSRDKVFSLNFREMLDDTLHRLDSDAAYMDLEFFYFLDKKSPVTNHVAPMGYKGSFHAFLNRQEYHLILGVTVPISTLCPCSKAISDYGAHNQRADLRVQVVVDTEAPNPVVWIEDLVAALEECASCPVYPILKRPDEKYVTERQYDNPKFVEDVVRDATLMLREFPAVRGFAIECEALESIHAHNAWAYHEENFAGEHRRPWFV